MQKTVEYTNNRVSPATVELLQPRRRRNQGTIGVFGTMIADTAMRAAGLTERAAKNFGFDLVTGGGGVTAGEIANIMAQAIAAGMTASDMAVSQVGTPPALTASPLVYQIVNAAEAAVAKLR